MKNKSDVTHTKARTSGILYLKDARNNEISHTIFPNNVQIGLKEIRKNLMLTGGLSFSVSHVIPSNYDSLQYFVSNEEVLISVESTATSDESFIKLSATPNEGQFHIIKDSLGVAGTENVIISSAGNHTIDGQVSTSISTDYGHVKLVFNGTQWSVIT